MTNKTSPPSSNDTPPRIATGTATPAAPKIGLALGGGVARGWAHIGVIRALDRAGIKPDIICGTSAGALAGGTYAAGKLDALEDFARRMTRRGVFRILDVAVSGGGLFGGKKLEAVLEEHLGGITIEALNQQFVSVTTELTTGHEIWLRDGPLVPAIQASYALPGIFPPQNINGQWLIDGALVNPVPVSVCRALGARLVIAVNLNADAFGLETFDDNEERLSHLGLGNLGHLATEASNVPIRKIVARPEPEKKPEPPEPDENNLSTTRKLRRRLFGTPPTAEPDGPTVPGVSTVMMAAFTVTMDRLTRARLAGDPPDITIAPPLGNIGLLEFDRAAEMINAGDAAAQRALPYIEHALDVLST
ncbi:MAG: patatin-like phospholipase family protein [Alphaproteobacteria bacterium]